VALLDRGQSVRSVLLGVILGAHPEEPDVEQSDGARQDALSRKAIECEVAGARPAQAMEGSPELDHVLELGLVPALPPGRVVEVLLASGRVCPHGLEVAVRDRTDPHVLPRGRDHQPPDTFEHVRFRHPPASGVQVLESPSAPTPGEPRL
jgi:hypothetical protein